MRESNQVGRGRYTAGRGSVVGQSRPLVARMVKLPWIPGESEWLRLLEVAPSEPICNRLMLALAYDSALRREVLCSLRTDDLDPAHRTLRVRAETTKNRLGRVVPYSAATGVLRATSRCRATSRTGPGSARGKITSHGARSTIASQLYNAKEPMTLSELQAWLGPSHTNATQHYAKDQPEQPVQGLHPGLLLRPRRMHHRGAPRPRRHHLRRRRHRPAVATRPGPQLLQLQLFRAGSAPDDLRPMRLLHPERLHQSPAIRRQRPPPTHARPIPLTDDGRAAVDDGHTAVTALLDRLADVPTPAGPTPRQLGTPATVTMLPIVQIRAGKA